MSAFWVVSVSSLEGTLGRKARSGDQEARRPLRREGKGDCDDGGRDQSAADSSLLPLEIGTGLGVGPELQIKVRFLLLWQRQRSFLTPATHLRKSLEARK